MRTIIKAIIRILVLFFVIQALSPIVNYIYNLIVYSKQYTEYFIPYLVSIIVGLVITGLIIYFGWWKTDKIVGFLAGDLDENQLVINTSNLDLYKVIISIFGIWLIIDAIPGLIGIIASQIYCSNNKSIFGSYQDVFGNNIRLGVIQLVELIIGIFLVTGNFVVVKVLRNIWKSGSIHEENDNKQ